MPSEEIRRSKEFWDSHAKRDPLWAILSDPVKKDRRWDLNEFLATGRREISLLMYQLRTLGLEVSSRAALDFGCGIGRLSQPLASYFDQVVGVDVSPEMVRLADQINDRLNIRFVANDQADLSILSANEFTFAYSNVVLQHIEPEVALGYIREFLRVVAPGGVLVFQLPSHGRPRDEHRTVSTSMPLDAYRASLNVSGHVPSEVVPGAEVVLAFDVGNVSPSAWCQPAVGPIRLGNHWVSSHTGEMLVQDDGRAVLPPELGPGESCRVFLTASAPQEPGEYFLECDVVHEGISWFADRGSSKWRHPVRVVGRISSDVVGDSGAAHTATTLDLSHDPAPVSDTLPMFGVHHEVVESLIREHGGEVVLREIDERCGEEWIGYRYFVRKL